MTELQAFIQKQMDKQTRQMDAQASKMEDRMNILRMEMESRLTDVQSQNQLLLSKISALSSQNSNAPGIFDGADRRKREAKEEKLRQSGQKVTPAVQQRQLAFFDMECEFFENCGWRRLILFCVTQIRCG